MITAAVLVDDLARMSKLEAPRYQALAGLTGWARAKRCHVRHYLKAGVPLCGAKVAAVGVPHPGLPIRSARCYRCENLTALEAPAPA